MTNIFELRKVPFLIIYSFLRATVLSLGQLLFAREIMEKLKLTKNKNSEIMSFFNLFLLRNRGRYIKIYNILVYELINRRKRFEKYIPFHFRSRTPNSCVLTTPKDSNNAYSCESR